MLLSEHGVAEGIWKARAGLFLWGMVPSCPKRWSSASKQEVLPDHTAVAGKIPRVVYLKLSGCCRCPPCTAADTGAELGPGFKLQGDMRF